MSTTAKIVKTPDVLGGKPRAEGVRVGILQVNDMVRENGMDIDTVMDELRLDRQQVEAALEYYDDHPPRAGWKPCARSARRVSSGCANRAARPKPNSMPRSEFSAIGASFSGMWIPSNRPTGSP